MTQPVFSATGMNYVCCDQNDICSEKQEDVCRRKGDETIHREKEDADRGDCQIGVDVKGVWMKDGTMAASQDMIYTKKSL